MDDDRISVCVRIRPPIGKESYEPLCLRKAQNEQTIILTPEESAANAGELVQYQFDHTFDETDNQQVVYEECVQDLVDCALSGSNTTVFAYGQTGSGKTFTILGDTYNKTEDGSSACGENSGVFIRVLDDVFRYRDVVRSKIHMKVTLSIIELYVEDVLDLLANKKKLKLRESGEETLALGMTTKEVTSLDDVLGYFHIANQFRSVTSTKMNQSSSRSHALFFIDIYQFPQAQFPTCPAMSDLLDAHGVVSPTLTGMVRSRISLIDLAGSERVKKSGVSGQAMVEAQAINKSLSTLGTVINAMYTKNPHIPFRESKLTRLLKPCFVQTTSRLLLIGQASPPSSSASESLGTLRFCDRVKGLQAPATPAFLDPKEEERYLRSKRLNHELCAEMRIAGVLYYHQPVNLHRLAEERGTTRSDEQQRVEGVLRQTAGTRAETAEAAILQAYEGQMMVKGHKEVEQFILMMNNRIEDYEVIARELKGKKKEWKKKREEYDAAIEEATHAAKKAKKERVKQQERVLAINESITALATPTVDGVDSFDAPDELQKEEDLLAAATAAADAEDAGDEVLMTVFRDFVRSAADSARTQSEFISRLSGVAQCRSEVRKTKMRSSAIMAEGTTIDDLLSFMIGRAVDIVEGNVPGKLGWTWKTDVDGCSTRLLGPTELYPPLLPPHHQSANRRRQEPHALTYHNRTFVSSDDSDGECSHYPQETRHRHNFTGATELFLEDVEGEEQHQQRQAPAAAVAADSSQSGSSSRHHHRHRSAPVVAPVPAVAATAAPLPVPEAPAAAQPAASAEDLAHPESPMSPNIQVEDDGSSEDDEGEELAPPPVNAAWEGEDPAAEPTLGSSPRESTPFDTPAPVVVTATTGSGTAPIVTAAVAAPAIVHMEGGEKQRRRRHRSHRPAADDEEAAPGAALASGATERRLPAEEEAVAAVVTVHRAPRQVMSTAGEAEEESDEEAPEASMSDVRGGAAAEEGEEEETKRGLGGSRTVAGMVEELKRRRRKHKTREGGAAGADGLVEPEAQASHEAEEEDECIEEVEVKMSKEAEDRRYLMKVYDSPTLVADLVKFLRGGTVMLKHGRMGKPHRRLFWVSSARGKPELLWMDPDSRFADRSSIKLDDVAYINLGSFSKVFKRHPIRASTDAFYRCFTVGLKHNRRTVDIVADTVADYEAWVVGLSWMIGVDPCWGGKPDISREREFDQLTFFESNLCETNYVMPIDYLTLKKEVQRRVAVVKTLMKQYNNNAALVQRELSMFHPPTINEKGALYMTKGELRFLVPQLKFDIFRISFIWIHFEQLHLIYDPDFSPATAFGVTFRK